MKDITVYSSSSKSLLGESFWKLNVSTMLLAIALMALLCAWTASGSEPYWQQYVHYTIGATLNPDRSVITGSETLIYKNNSPDTLKVVYFRLYWNLFTHGSYGERFARRNKQYYFDTTGGIWLNSFRIGSGSDTINPVYTVDNTLMEVPLPKPLVPGDSIEFGCTWEEKVPEGGDRAGHQGRDYNIAQWYPQIATYDRYGWDRNQYLGPAEFHNEYGTFDVQVTLPRSFLLGYSGVLLNPEEIYPDSVRQKLKDSFGNDSTTKIADYSNQDWKDSDTVAQTWKFRAENVRDFAWSANEHYIWDVAYWTPPGSSQPIAAHALYFDDLPQFWKDVAHFGRHALSFFSMHYGLYSYPSMFVVEGVVGGGMEYPGIVFLGHIGDKNYHDLYGVTAHEIGHSWYPMMIESNETYFAFMDEGFNTFITCTAVEDYYGRHNNGYEWTEWYQKFFRFDNDDERAGIQRGSLYLARTGYEEPIATHTNRFREQGLSGISIYSKTASVMFMLQYVLGDSVFGHAMQEYYRRYRFKHVYPEDFYATMQEASGNRDLRWFFDEWFNRTSTCDYGVSGLHSDQVSSNPPTYRTKIAVHRYGDAIMPVDVQFTMADGSTKTIWFPIDKWSNTEVKRDTTIDLPSQAIRAELNPDGRILDINRLNNTTGLLPKMDVGFNNTLFSVSPLDAYRLLWRPSLWYTDEGGYQAGLKFEGNYLENMDRTNLGLWYNFREQTLDYDAGIGQNTYYITPQSNVDLRMFHLEGVEGGEISASKGFRDHFSYPPYHTITLKYSFMRDVNTDYLLHPQTWQSGDLQRFIAGYQYENRGERWNVNAGVTLEGSMALFGTNDFQYSKRTIAIRGGYNLPEGSNFLLRLYNGMGYGNVPLQTQYYIGGGSPIEQFASPLFRSEGMIPASVGDHAFFPGGGDMRGYYDQNAAGTKIEAINAELRFASFLPEIGIPRIPLISYITRQFNSSIFCDAGRLASAPQNLWDQRYQVDWGVGFRMTTFPRILGPLGNTNLFQGIGLKTLRIDFPLYLSAPLPGESKLAFRWVIGFSDPI